MRKIRDWFRDMTRDELTEVLNTSGIRAKMAERGQPEEEFKREGSSLGVIDIAHGPVRWINVVSHEVTTGQGRSTTKYRCVFGIPEERGFPPGTGEVNLSSVRRKSFPVFGSVKGVEWKGEEGGTGLVSALTAAPEVEAFCLKFEDLHIRGHQGAFQGWTVEMEELKRFSGRDWATVEALARLLLS